MKSIFFDTEFTELGVDPKLISIGLVSDDGQEFYADLSDTYVAEDCSAFVLEAVVPHLERGATLMTMDQLAIQLGQWLEAFDQPVRLATDSLAWDWSWLHEIFHQDGTWPQNVEMQPFLFTINCLNGYDLFVRAVERAFSGGLRRHHALDDAKANRLGWIAAGVDSRR